LKLKIKNFKNEIKKWKFKKKTHLAYWFLLAICSSKNYLQKQIGGREYHPGKHKQGVASGEE